jgi:hypothetical protein
MSNGSDKRARISPISPYPAPYRLTVFLALTCVKMPCYGAMIFCPTVQ